MSHGGLSLFVGPDRPRKLERIRALEGELHVAVLDRHQHDAASLSPAELLALCRQQPAASPLRLIVIDQAHRLDRACVESLQAHAGAIAKSARVILLVEVELSSRHALWKVVQEHGGGEDPRQRTSARTPAGFAIEQFPGRAAVVAKPFAMTDALGGRDVAGVLSAMHEQLACGKEPLELLGLVAWQLHRWVLVRRLCDGGEGSERMAYLTGLRPWQIQRLRAEVADRSLESLQHLLERCWELDVGAKSGRQIPQLALEQLVLEICRAG